VSVKGNILLLQKLDTFWNQVQGSRNDPELPFVRNLMLSDVCHVMSCQPTNYIFDIRSYKVTVYLKANPIFQPLIPGLKSEVIIFDLIQRIVRLPNLLSEGSTVQLDILKNGTPASTWSKYPKISLFSIIGI